MNHLKNRLNNLSGKEWVKATKTVWMDIKDKNEMYSMEKAMETGILFSESPPRDDLKKKHPATFSENDITKLILFFTKPGEVVLDPFSGVGSTAIACIQTGRDFIGIELYSEWVFIARQRIAKTVNQYNVKCELYSGNSLEVMRTIQSNSIDFIVTSPPYWGILGKKDHKAKRERIEKGLVTEYGTNSSDLSRIQSYEEFLKSITEHFIEYHRILKYKRYAALIVSDFRHGKEYYMFHADIKDAMKTAGFTIQGLIVLVQDNKKLYPYGYPTTYVPNVNNQFIVIGRKL